MLLFYVYHATPFVLHALVMQITLAYRANYYLVLLDHLLLAYVIAFLAIIRIPSISLALHATILIVAFAQEQEQGYAHHARLRITSMLTNRAPLPVLLDFIPMPTIKHVYLPVLQDITPKIKQPA